MISEVETPGSNPGLRVFRRRRRQFHLGRNYPKKNFSVIAFCKNLSKWAPATITHLAVLYLGSLSCPYRDLRWLGC